MADSKKVYQRAINIQNVKIKKNVKKVVDKAVPAVKDTTKKVVKKIKPVVSSAINKGKSKVKNLKINQKVSNVANTRNVKGARLLGARAKGLFIDSTRTTKLPRFKGGKFVGGKIKAMPLINLATFFHEKAQREEELIAQGYSKKEARNRALTIELGGLLGGQAAGSLTAAAGTALTTGATAGSLGTATLPAAAGSLAATALAYNLGDRAGEGIGTWLSNKLGHKIDQETLNKRLAQRQVLNNRLEHARIQAGGAN